MLLFIMATSLIFMQMILSEAGNVIKIICLVDGCIHESEGCLENCGVYCKETMID